MENSKELTSPKTPLIKFSWCFYFGEKGSDEMTFDGFSIEDWGALVTLVAVIAGGILTMFRYIVLKPLNDSIKELGRKIASLGEQARRDARENAQEINGLGDRVTDQDKRLTSLEAWKETSERYVKSD